MTDAIKLAIDALEAACGNRCNAEYNPCQAREDLAALRAQPAESACPECHCHFTGSLPFDYEVTAPGSTRLVNTAQPNHIVDASGMVDHSELIAKLRDHKAGLSIHRNELMQAAADALEGKTK